MDTSERRMGKARMTKEKREAVRSELLNILRNVYSECIPNSILEKISECCADDIAPLFHSKSVRKSIDRQGRLERESTKRKHRNSTETPDVCASQRNVGKHHGEYSNCRQGSNRGKRPRNRDHAGQPYSLRDFFHCDISTKRKGQYIAQTCGYCSERFPYVDGSDNSDCSETDESIENLITEITSGLEHFFRARCLVEQNATINDSKLGQGVIFNSNKHKVSDNRSYTSKAIRLLAKCQNELVESITDIVKRLLAQIRNDGACPTDSNTTHVSHSSYSSDYKGKQAGYDEDPTSDIPAPQHEDDSATDEDVEIFGQNAFRNNIASRLDEISRQILGTILNQSTTTSGTEHLRDKIDKGYCSANEKSIKRANYTKEKFIQRVSAGASISEKAYKENIEMENLRRFMKHARDNGFSSSDVDEIVNATKQHVFARPFCSAFDANKISASPTIRDNGQVSAPEVRVTPEQTKRKAKVINDVDLIVNDARCTSALEPENADIRMNISAPKRAECTASTTNEECMDESTVQPLKACDLVEAYNEAMPDPAACGVEGFERQDALRERRGNVKCSDNVAPDHCATAPSKRLDVELKVTVMKPGMKNPAESIIVAKGAEVGIEKHVSTP